MAVIMNSAPPVKSHHSISHRPAPMNAKETHNGSRIHNTGDMERLSGRSPCDGESQIACVVGYFFQRARPNLGQKRGRIKSVEIGVPKLRRSGHHPYRTRW